MPAITRVDVIATAPKMPSVKYTDALPAVFTTVTFVEIEDETGTIGIGAIESDSFGAFDLGPLESLRPMIPGLIGRDSAQPAAIRRLLESRAPSTSRLVPGAAVEIALWDLMGKRAGLPLYQLLGGARHEIPVYASLPFEQEIETLLSLVERVTSEGYPAVKLHVSGDPDHDVFQVGETRKQFPTLELMVDAESVYGRREAAQVGRALDLLDIRWFEAPLPDRDIEGYRALTRSLHTPIIPAGGVVNDLREMTRALMADAWSAVRIQTMEGGIAYMTEVAALARAFGVDFEVTSYGTTLTQAIDLHVMLGLGAGNYYEQPYPVGPWEFGTTESLTVLNGSVRAPSGPGLGMTLDRAAIDAATLSGISVPGDTGSK